MTKSLYKPSYEKFRRHLKELRLEKGFTQEEIAASLGKRQSFIQKCESGERRVDIVELDEICTLLGSSLEEFVANYKKRK